MGNSCGTTRKRTGYSDAEYDEEIEIRRFEEEIGFNKRSLNSVLPRICLEKDIISIAAFDDFIVNNFSENFLNLIRQDYFYKSEGGVNYYDARKINMLLFLFTRDTQINNGRVKYHDKTSFVFTTVKTREDQNLCEPITDSEENFLSFITDLYEISCEAMVDCYYKVKNLQRDGVLKKMKECKKEVIELISHKLMENQNERKSGSLSFEDMNQKMGSDSFMFSPGWVREFAWFYIMKGKANEKKDEEKKPVRS